MSKLGWYWYRLRAMSAGEMALHARKKLRQAADAKRTSWPESDLICSGAFPKLPKPEDASEVLREALRRDVENILAGRWRFFGHLEVQVDDPPKWQFDPLVRCDVETTASAFNLNYRSLKDGVDSKLVWEPSRWNQLVRLAMAAYVLGDCRAGEKCLVWLEDWVKHNPPYRGWNWTSALEVGLRLIQFAWIDALLSGSSRGDEAQISVVASNSSDQSLLTSAATIERRLAGLRRAILPPHVWYAWRHKSFGSSANNHLLGELAGCIVATARWPGLAICSTSLDELQRRWEHEVLAQFAEDGGNKEQALNYQLFSWEFCWQSRMALASAGRNISRGVDERLRRAAQFFVDVQVPSDPWDYGDSDDAFVTPLFADDRQVAAEWHEWFREPSNEQALEYWMGKRNAKRGVRSAESGRGHALGQHFERSGYAISRERDWILRCDLSPLGLGTMAAHGHLDALHVSLWLRGVALVVDPGTGAYHSDKHLRNWLTSRDAHNCPTPESEEWPCRLGPFLWAEPHEAPLVKGGFARVTAKDWGAEFSTKAFSLYRCFKISPEGSRIEVEDSVSKGRETRGHARRPFTVRWQFAPESRVEELGERRYRVTRHEVSIEVQASADWAEVFCVTEQNQVAQADPNAPLAGTVSPAFRKTVWAPYLKLVARPHRDKTCVFTTTFLAWPG